ncbi:MAG: hypothetical protein AB7G93_22070 [Bdellovibrionales bacterium]
MQIVPKGKLAALEAETQGTLLEKSNNHGPSRNTADFDRLRMCKMMRFCQVLSLLLFLIFPLCSGAAVPSWPLEVRASLARWKNVISVAYDESGREASGVVVKRWKVKSAKGEPVLSEELPLTQKTVFRNPSDPRQGGTIEWKYGALKLSDPPTLDSFVWGVRSGSDVFTLTQPRKNKIVLKFTERKFVVILMPASREDTEDRYLVGSQILPGISVTPNNDRKIGDLSIKALFGTDLRPFPGPRYFFNHPIRTETRQVFVSQNFPNRYIDVLQKVLSQWNQLFGHDYYLFAGKQNLDAVDCLSENILCIQWSGGEEFTWTGYHGTTTVTADPSSGRVLGGIIYLYNNADRSIHRKGTVEELALVEDPSSFAQVALGFSQLGKYSQILRPNSDGLVTSLLLHEMGHFFGWDHNFAGAWLGDPSKGTVMGYPPFNLDAEFVHLGEIDKVNFQLLYGSRNVPAMPFCGDLDIEPTYDGKIWRKKIPECLMWSAGRSIDWLIANATILGLEQLVVGWDVYKAIAPEDSRLGSYLAALGFIAKDGQYEMDRKKAQTYLCSESLLDPKVLPFLSEHLGLELNCH